ncbi:MAG: ABC transporter substrate-binding protein [Castellaniella sp.]
MKNLTKMVLGIALISLTPVSKAELSKLSIPLGAGGFGFLPLYVMKEHRLIEKQAEKRGNKVTVDWSNIGGPSAMIDALISGSAHFVTAGPPSFLLLWDRTKGSANVKGVAAMSSMPMFLNTRASHLKSIDDLKDGDKIAVTSVKSSIPSIVMQMYAVEKYGKDQAFRFDPFTVSMNHGDAAASLISDSGGITAHYASYPLAQREMKTEGIHTIQNTDDVMGGSTNFTMVSTTTKFYEENPKLYESFVAALEEAQALIKSDKPMAADILIASMGGSGKPEDMIEILNDPKIKYTSVPENVMKYANFMYMIESIKNKPNDLADLFFPGSAISAGN